MIDSHEREGLGSEKILTVCLDAAGVKAFKGRKPKEVLVLVVTGEVERITMEAPSDPAQKGLEGCATLKIRKLEVRTSQQNAMAELLEDE